MSKVRFEINTKVIHEGVASFSDHILLKEEQGFGRDVSRINDASFTETDCWGRKEHG